uniref:AIR synthase related protein, C-terminal domain n=1 Tax=Candidatus Kentrum sp. LFY TaxID=2126342 RepID=A0A450U625_9GAMM|nr:MAG: AIR synthase related protein, C-terminal domain [Candidatus Kentron sp. LFY]
MGRIEVGDAILVSGPVGDHGIAVLLAWEKSGLQGELQFGTSRVPSITRALLLLRELHFMRGSTRRRFVTVPHEIHRGTGFGIRLRQSDIPVRDSVQTVCEILGYDPLYLVYEGRVMVVVDPSEADEALAVFRPAEGDQETGSIGTVEGVSQRQAPSRQAT